MTTASLGILCAAFGVLAGAAAVPAQGAQLDIAHRGASAYAPEHTFLAHDQAMDMDVDMLECDLILTKDEVPVCIHDETVDRTTGGTSTGRVDIRGRFVGSPPAGMSEAERESATGVFSVVDEFEIRARDPLLERAFAVPPREPASLLASFDAIARHTRERNRRHLLGHAHA